MCLPALRWLHRFERPAGVPYACTWEDHLRNYLIGWSELGWDTTEVCDHYTRETSPELVTAVRAAVMAELAHPTARFDGAVYPVPARAFTRSAQHGIDLPAATASLGPAADLSIDGAGSETHAAGSVSVPAGTASVGIAIPAVIHPDPDVADLLTHRRCLLFARLHGWRSVLIGDTHAALAACTHDTLDTGTTANRDLAVLLPAPTEDTVAAGSHQRDAGNAVVGYCRGDHLRVLDILPATPRAAARWITSHGPLRDWLQHHARDHPPR